MPWRRLVLYVTLLVLVGACSAPSGPVASSDGRSIVIGAGSEPDNLNPILGFAPDGASKIFDGLVSRDASLALVPALAEQLPTASADGLTWAVTLRPDVTFSDGTPLSAQDMVFTFQSVLDPKVDTTIASHYDALAQVSAPDERTVVFGLKYPYAPFAQRLLLGIVPRNAFEGRDINTAPFNTAPVGTGPYPVAEWRKGDRMVLQTKERYWDGAPAVKTATVVFVTDDNARATRRRPASSTPRCCRRSWPRRTPGAPATRWCSRSRLTTGVWGSPRRCRSPPTPRCAKPSTSWSTGRR